MGSVSCFPFPPGREWPQQPRVTWKKVSSCSISVSLPRSESGYWDEDLLVAFIPWAAVAASRDPLESPWEALRGCCRLRSRSRSGVVARTRESSGGGSFSSIPHPRVPGFEVSGDTKFCP